MKLVTKRLGLLSVLAASGVFSVVGCSSGNKEQTSNNAGDASEEALSTTDTLHTHYMPVARNGMIHKPRTQAQVAASPSDLTYRGGPLIQKGKVYTVFWGASIANQDALGTFFGDVGASAHMDMLAQYSTNGMNIQHATFAGKVVDTNPPAGTTITNDQIGQELERLIANGTAPAPDNDSLYMMYFPPG